jgi:hypothetical protein
LLLASLSASKQSERGGRKDTTGRQRTVIYFPLKKKKAYILRCLPAWQQLQQQLQQQQTLGDNHHAVN